MNPRALFFWVFCLLPALVFGQKTKPISRLDSLENALVLIEKGSENYALAVLEIALIRLKKGEIQAAEPLLIEAKTDLERLEKNRSKAYSNALLNLGHIYADLGSMQKSDENYRAALAVLEQLGLEKTPHFGHVLNCLAVNLESEKRDDEALALFLQARAIDELPENQGTVERIPILINLGGFYAGRGRHLEAEPVLEAAKNQILAAFGPQHFLHAALLRTLAFSSEQNGKPEKALAEQLAAIEIYEKTLGTESLEYLESRSRAGQLLADLGMSTEAVPHFLAVNERIFRLRKDAAAFSSEAELIEMESHFAPFFDDFMRFSSENAGLNLSGHVFDIALVSKNALLENAVALQKSLENAASETQALFKNWKNCHAQLADFYSKPLAERDGLADLEQKADDLEKILARKNAAFLASRRAVVWQEIEQKLAPSEAAVEFIQYKKTNDSGQKTTFYAALLLFSDGKEPRFVPLFEAQKLEKKLSNRAGGPALFLKKLYAAPAAGTSEPSLFELIWQPLEPFLSGTKTVFFAPVGLLHRVNLGAVGVESLGSATVVLADRFRLVQVGSTRELLKRRAFGTEKTPRTAAIFGGIRYEMDSVAIAEANQKLDSADAPNPETDDIAVRGGDWDFLQGAAREADETRAFFVEKGIKMAYFTGFEATEDAFARFGKKRKAPEILHLATHGFFFPAPSETAASEAGAAFKTSENPMMRSGLLFAGANRAWRTGRAVTGARDGILTAYETSQMSLAGTRLAVLSACETGLGEVAGAEGVFGLQRAFRLAGAEAVLMSLWAAPDEKTRELMGLFYQNWLEKGHLPADALASAQAEMRRKWPNPFFWAGFVLVGE